MYKTTNHKLRSNAGSNESKGIQSISTHKERKNDTIPFRIDFVQDLLKENNLETIIDFANLDTEAFTHPNGYNSKDNLFMEEENNNSQDHDIRKILNKKEYNFHRIISDIGGKLRYVKSGSSGHTFKGMIVTENGVNINYGVKVVAYPKKEGYGDLNDARRPENAELMMIKLLSYFVINKQSPHIALPIGTFYTSINPFVNLIDGGFIDDKNKKYQEFVDRYKKGIYYDTVSILISEWANKGDLLEFIKKNYKEFTTLHWKVVFFQIISVLAIIQHKFPSFRHNDLKANNVLIHRIEPGGQIFGYTINNKKYYLPNKGYQIKLWDFDFACIPGIVENSKVSAKWTDEINVKPIKNRYYDMHYFFNTLIKRGFFPELMTSPEISCEIKNFINRIVPAKYQNCKTQYVSAKGRILNDDEYLLPDDVLKNDIFFEEFRNYNPKKTNNSNNNNNNINNNKINTVSSTETRRKYVLSK
jgi:hypothetical protein